MGKYNGAIITSAGQNLIAQAIAQGQTVTFTTMQASSNAYPSSTDFEALTSLIDVEATADISYAGVYNNNVVQISARIDNTGVETAYLINTLGVFAQVGSATPILLAVITAVTPDQMPVYDANNPSAFIYNVQITVQNAESISVSVNPAGTVNVDQFNQAINSLQTQITTINDNAFFTTDSATTTINNEDYIPIQQSDGKKKTLFSTLVAKLNGLITKIGTSTLGNSNTPIYLNNGTPTQCNEFAPKSHASTGTGYGPGNASNYGHVKVSDNYTSSAGNASQSVAASSQAVKNCYDAIKPVNYWFTHTDGNVTNRISTNSSVYTGGVIQAQYARGLAIVVLDDTRVKLPNAYTLYLVATGLPKAVYGQVTWAKVNTNTGVDVKVYADNNGYLYARSEAPASDIYLSGEVVYFTNW